MAVSGSSFAALTSRSWSLLNASVPLSISDSTPLVLASCT